MRTSISGASVRRTGLVLCALVAAHPHCAASTHQPPTVTSPEATPHETDFSPRQHPGCIRNRIAGRPPAVKLKDGAFRGPRRPF